MSENIYTIEVEKDDEIKLPKEILEDLGVGEGERVLIMKGKKTWHILNAKKELDSIRDMMALEAEKAGLLDGEDVFDIEEDIDPESI